VLWETIVAGQPEAAADAFTAVHGNMSDILELRGQTAEYEIPAPREE
jgi:hypothetical protein